MHETKLEMKTRQTPNESAKDRPGLGKTAVLLSQNRLSLIGVVLTTSSAITLIGFWIYDFMLPGPPHPYIGILLFLLLPRVFDLGLVLIPVGIVLRWRKLRGAGELPTIYPAIDLKTPMVRSSFLFVA